MSIFGLNSFNLLLILRGKNPFENSQLEERNAFMNDILSVPPSSDKGFLRTKKDISTTENIPNPSINLDVLISPSLEKLNQEFPGVRRNRVDTIPVMVSGEVDPDILKYFTTHEDYFLDGEGRLIHIALQKELEAEKSRCKELEKKAKNMEHIQERHIDLEDRLGKINKEKSELSNEYQKELDELRKKVSTLKEENLSIKMGKFELEKVIYSEMKDSLNEKQDSMAKEIQNLKVVLLDGAKAYIDFQKEIKGLQSKEKSIIDNAVEREKINDQLSGKLKISENSLKQSKIVIDSQNLKIQLLEKKIQNQDFIDPFSNFIQD